MSVVRYLPNPTQSGFANLDDGVSASYAEIAVDQQMISAAQADLSESNAGIIYWGGRLRDSLATSGLSEKEAKDRLKLLSEIGNAGVALAKAEIAIRSAEDKRTSLEARVKDSLSGADAAAFSVLMQYDPDHPPAELKAEIDAVAATSPELMTAWRAYHADKIAVEKEILKTRVEIDGLQDALAKAAQRNFDAIDVRLALSELDRYTAQYAEDAESLGAWQAEKKEDLEDLAGFLEMGSAVSKAIGSGLKRAAERFSGAADSTSAEADRLRQEAGK